MDIAFTCVCCGSSDLERSPAVLMPFVAHRTFGWAPTEITDEWGLRSIESGRAYTLCSSLLCKSCSFLFLDMRFNDDELGRLYEGYRGDAYTSMRDGYEPGYAERNAKLADGYQYLSAVEVFLSPHVKGPISILDWGGDTGQNSPFAGSRARLDVYDISGQPVIEGAQSVTKEDLKKENYNLVVLAHVLEHVPYPVPLLQEIAELLTPSTVLYIEVPHEAALHDTSPAEAHAGKRHWHEHINFFCQSSLEAAATSAGLQVIDFGRIVTDPASGAAAYQLACRLKEK